MPPSCSPLSAIPDWPRRVRSSEALLPDVPADVFGPIANIKDWELIDGGKNRQPRSLVEAWL